MLGNAIEQDPSISTLPEFDKVLGKILLDTGHIKEALDAFNRYEADKTDTGISPMTIHKALALYLSGSEMDATQLVHSAMKLLKDESNDLLYRISIGIELIDYMFQTGNIEQAEKLNLRYKNTGTLALRLRTCFKEKGDRRQAQN